MSAGSRTATIVGSVRTAARAARAARGLGSRVTAARLSLADASVAGRDRTSVLSVGVGDSTVDVCCRLDQSDYEVFHEVFVERSYHLPVALRPRDVRVVLDLGANVGMASAYLGALFPQAHVISVEPLPANLALLRRTAAGGTRRWDVVPAAVGAGGGTAPFHWSGWYSSGTLRTHIAASRQGDAERPESQLAQAPVQVDVLDVDDVLERCGEQRADVVKLDIEGSEADVVRADRAWLRAARVVLIEVHERYVDGGAVRDELRGAGLSPAGRGGRRSELWVRPEAAA